MKWKDVVTVGILVLCVSGGTVSAQNLFQTDFTAEEILDQVYTLRAGAWFQEADGNISLDESMGDTDVDFEQDLGLDENDDFAVRAEFQPWQKHHFRLGYNGIQFDGDNVLSRTVVIDGDPYSMGDRVVTDLELDTYEIGYRYDVWRGENFVVAPLIQVNLVDASVHIQDLGPAFVGKAEEDILAPLPLIGLQGEYFPHPRFGVFAEVKGFTIGSTASVLDIEAGGQINLLKNLSIIAGYRYFDFDFEISDVEADLSIDGPFVSGQIRF